MVLRVNFMLMWFYPTYKNKLKNRQMKYFTSFMLAMVAVLSLNAQQQASPVVAEKISERLYQLKGGSGANGGFYVGDNGVLVIDSKMSEESQLQVFDAIKKVTDLPIKYLVNTHADGDHVNGNIYFPENVTIISHENCRAEFFVSRNETPSSWLNPAMAKGVPSITYKERMDIYLGDKKVEFYYFGVGHTTGDTYIYFKEEDVAFIGDQFFETRVQLIHTYKGGSAVQYVATMDRMLAAIPAKQFCSGHSEIASRDKIVAHVNMIRDKVGTVRSLKSQNNTLDQIKARFPEGEAALIEGIYNEL